MTTDIDGTPHVRTESVAWGPVTAAYHRALFEQSPDGLFVADAAGRYLDVNPAGCRLLGYTRAELLDMSAGCVFRGCDPRERLAAARPGDTVLGEFEMARKDGTMIGVEIHASLLDDGRRLEVVRDITVRRREVEAMGEAQRLYLSLVNLLPHSLYRVDLDGRITFVNAKLLARLDRPIEEIIGKTAHDFYPPELARAYRDTDEQVIRTGASITRVEPNVSPATAERSFVEVVKTPIYGTDGRVCGVQGVVWDVTARERLETALRESERRLAEAQQISRVGSWELDLATGKILWSEEMYRIFAVSPGAFDGTTEMAIQVFHPEDRAQILAATEKALTELRPQPIDARVLLPDGTVRHVHGEGRFEVGPDGQFLKVSGTYQDVTERRLAEAALRASEYKYRVLLENTLDAILLADDQGRVLEANRVTCDLFGYSLAELRAMSVWELSYAGDAGRTRWELLLQRGSLRGDNQLRRKDGQPLDCEYQCVTNVLPGVHLCALHDVTGRNRATARAAELERGLLAAQKLESLGLMASGVAHDVNNLLVPITGNAGLLRMQYPDEPAIQDALADIEVAAHHASELARQMLAFAGHSQGTFAPLDLNVMVREMAVLWRASLPVGARIELDLASGRPFVNADATQLRQVVMNIILNAADALGGETGTIYLSTRLQPSLEPTGDPQVVLTIRDTGRGIEPAALPRIFDPFFSTKAAGRGLGLAAAQGIVRAHRGTLHVYSVAGEGSTFSIQLPGVAAAPGPLAGRPAETTAKSGVWLIIDDERMVRSSTARLLQFLGYRTLDAEDGPSGLRVFGEHMARVSGVVLDLTMPGMNGHEVFRELRARDPRVPVVIISGYSDADVSALLAADRAVFLPKPFSIDALRGALTRVEAS